MANLPESPSWWSGIHQLEESDRAKAGPGGILNLQAQQLAERTRWLRDMIESVPDYREYTFYSTETDPDGTIAGIAGTPEGQLFRVVIGPDDGFKYYRNENGVAVQWASISGESVVLSVVAAQSFFNSVVPQDISASILGWAVAFMNSERTGLFGGFDESGGFRLAEMPDAVQDRLKQLGEYGLLTSIPGFHILATDIEQKSGFAVAQDWGLFLAGLEKSVQDEIADLKAGTGSAILRPYNGILAVYKDGNSATPVYAVSPVAYAQKLATGGA
ncbi:TPA: hypothetical protein NO555_005161, partial [Klebsiella variicola subsp. variicola]|nr:hypothetical protein [Klebsiella variicola subsp. variicola]HCI6660700.1 hypothetical protein [Klebsiella variicola subsp. variicola]